MVNKCEEIRELIGAYSIGATDAEETRLVEEALAECPELIDELADYAGVVTAMHEAIPLRYAAPPASRLFADLKPAQPEIAPVENKIINMPRRLWWISIAALFVVTVLAVGSNLLWLNRYNTLEQAQQVPLTQQPTRSPMAVMFDPAATHQRVLLPTSAGENGALARVIWNSEFEVGSLFVTGLDPLPPDMAYQLWAVRADETLSLGQFVVDDTGTGILIFQSPEPIVSFDALGISPEPATGSAVPTHDHVVVGNI